MKTNVATQPIPNQDTSDRAPSRLADVVTLAKVRVNALVVATTAGGYYMASPEAGGFARLVIACLGTALVASGAAAFNQVYEWDTDRLMGRTRFRPVAAGRMSRAAGLAVALALTAAGLGMLWAGTTTSAMIVAFVTAATYAGIYTPLKRVTSLSTVIGAVPGALPPLIGWAAAGGSVASPAAWSLFFIMFLWQLPHFLAIAWIYREDYGRAGLPMLTVVDTHGGFTGRQTVLWAAALVPCSQLPFLLGLTNELYSVGAVLLGLGQVWLAFRFARHRSIANARSLFLASIIYLPALWALMVAARG